MAVENRLKRMINNGHQPVRVLRHAQSDEESLPTHGLASRDPGGCFSALSVILQ